MLRQGSVARESLSQYQGPDEGQSLDDCFPHQTSAQRGPPDKNRLAQPGNKVLFILFKFQVRLAQYPQIINPTKCKYCNLILCCLFYFSLLQSDLRILANSKPQNSNFIKINFYPLVKIFQPAVCINLRKLLLTIAKLWTSIVVSTDSTLQSYDTKNTVLKLGWKVRRPNLYRPRAPAQNDMSTQSFWAPMPKYHGQTVPTSEQLAVISYLCTKSSQHLLVRKKSVFNCS